MSTVLDRIAEVASHALDEARRTLQVDHPVRDHVEAALREIDYLINLAASSPTHERTTALEWTALDGSLTIRFLQYINAKRAVRWHQNGGIKSWSALEWAGAMAGEAGEACNAAKKLKRIEDQIANLEEGRSLTDEQNASSQVVDEIADTVIYGVLLAERVGLDLEEAIRMKFNRKSEEYGFPERIPPNEPKVLAASPIEARRPRRDESAAPVERLVLETMREHEIAFASRMLAHCAGNKREACRVLDISYHTLMSYLRASSPTEPKE